MTRSQMRKATTDEQIHMVQMLARVIDDDPEVYDKLKQAILQEEETVDKVNMVGMTSDPGLPKTFREAMESDEAEHWLKATHKEIANFNNRKCWRIISRESVGHMWENHT